MNDDAQLLLRYARDHSEAAFAELVRRHVDLVYSAALRRCSGDTHRAEEVVQQVFTSLARNAEKLAKHPALGAWLYAATRNAVINLAVAEQRRVQREKEAVMSGFLSAENDASDWSELGPVLDEVMDGLNETDRTAVLMRFFKKHSFAEIGAALNVSENTARMRTERALEKLRLLLTKRGVKSSAAALALVLGQQAVIAAPAPLAVAVTATILSIPKSSVVKAGAVAGQGAAKMLVTAGALVVVAALVTLGIFQARRPRFDTTVDRDIVAKPLAGEEQINQVLAPSTPKAAEASAKAVQKPTHTPPQKVPAAITKPALPSDPKAVELLQKMAAAYAALTSYQDSGEVVACSLDGREVGRVLFQTNFRAPDRFSCSWSRRWSARSSWNGCLWWFGEKAGSYRSYNPNRQVPTSRSSVLVSALTDTLGGGFHVPLFFSGKAGERFFSLIDLVGVSLAEGVLHEDGVCYVVKGQHVDGTPFELWIGEKDFLLRKLRSAYPIPFLKSAGTSRAPERLLEENHRNVRTNRVLADFVFQEVEALASSIPQVAK